jgi:hypothetical protein
MSFDVLIPCSDKDACTLEACVEGVSKYLPELGRVFVLSPRRMTGSAAWLPDGALPFSVEDIRAILPATAERAGWYLKMLATLYAPIILETEFVLVVDGDVIFQRRCCMLSPDGVPFYATSREHHRPYFEHMARLLPGLRRVRDCSGIAHHLMVSRPVLEELHRRVEVHHQGTPFWRAFVACIDPAHASASGAADDEIYFNFMLEHFPDAGIVRPLAFVNAPTAAPRPDLDYIAVHSWMRQA